MECQSMTICREVLEKCLNVKGNFLNPVHDKCYCTNCYEGGEYYSRGKPLKRYVMPLGWCGFGILIDPRFDKEDIRQIFGTYHVAYHGTRSNSVNRILTNGFALPGDEFIGTNVNIRRGHISNQDQMFTSPSPNYSSFGEVYAATFDYKGMKFKTMFQVKQHPTSYEVQGETMSGRCKSKYIPDKEIEWKTRKRDSIIPIRILIKQVDIPVIYHAGDGSTYKGNWVNGKKQGKGTFTTSDGIKMTGQWVDDNMHGEILVNYPSGEERKGEWRYGYLIKWLSFKLANGDEYEGEILNDEYHGKGVYTWNDGSEYTGDWANGYSSGYGVMIYANWNKYDGEWKNGESNGEGVLTDMNGAIYDGSWKDDKRHGHATVSHSNGDLYEGTYINDKRHGRGIYTWKDGSKYNGNWANGYSNGFGVKNYANGNKYVGEWLNNAMNGQGEYIYNDGRKYKGTCAGGKMTEYGVFSYPDGRKSYIHGNGDGHGVFELGDESKDIGEWINGKRHETGP